MMNRKDNAQVGVVVAILMVSLIVAVMVLIQVYYVPNWMKDKEADHMDVVADQFSNLKFSMDLQATSKINTPITGSVTMGSKELPYFVSSRSFGSLNVLPPASSNFSILVTLQSGMVQGLYQPDPFDSGSINYVNSISKFELIISTLNIGDTFNISINGVKSMEVNVISNVSGFRITLKTTNSTGIILFNQTIAASLPQHEFRINLLNSDYKFVNDVIPFITAPYNISVNGSSNGDFSIRCYKYGSTTVPLSYPLGIIRYQSDNAYFVDQTYVYEGGAVILEQTTGEAIISSPFFSARNCTTSHIINMSIVDIIGMAGKTSASGYGTYYIRTNYSSYQDYKALAKAITINITTNYPSAWGRYLNNTMNNSGITNFTINANEKNNYVLIVIDGPQQGNPYDVDLRIRKTKIYAQIGPGWVS